jgi:hypothetical protein
MRKCFLSGIFLLFVALVLLFPDFLSAQGTKFTYSDHGRRDPFWPLISASGTILIYDANVEFSDMTLEGIIYDPKGDKLAIINTKVIKSSDHIGGFLVVSVEQDHVILRKDGQQFILKQKKEK